MIRHTHQSHAPHIWSDSELCCHCSQPTDNGQPCDALVSIGWDDIPDAADGFYSSESLNPPSGDDCVAVIISDGQWVGWADNNGLLAQNEK